MKTMPLTTPLLKHEHYLLFSNGELWKTFTEEGEFNSYRCGYVRNLDIDSMIAAIDAFEEEMRYMIDAFKS